MQPVVAQLKYALETQTGKGINAKNDADAETGAKAAVEWKLSVIHLLF